MSTHQRGFPKVAAWIASKRWGRWLASRIYTPLDKLVYRATGGRRGLSPRRAVLLLTTTGRKTGQPRRVPVLYLEDDPRPRPGRGRWEGRLWVMASNYGQPHHPAWSSNLLAHPEATVTIGSDTRRVRARLGSEEEKRALWPRLVELYPAWEAYAGWTDRSFRLFCLEPLD